MVKHCVDASKVVESRALMKVQVVCMMLENIITHLDMT